MSFFLGVKESKGFKGSKRPIPLGVLTLVGADQRIRPEKRLLNGQIRRSAPTTTQNLMQTTRQLVNLFFHFVQGTSCQLAKHSTRQLVYLLTC